MRWQKMPFDSNGKFSLVPSYKATSGQTILVSQHNPPFEDVASALSQTLLRSGVAPMVGALNLNTYKIINLANGSDASDAVNFSQLQSFVPVGTIVDFAGTTAPDGWIFTAGQEILRATYAALFAVIGTTFGAGDGSTTFNAPDTRGRVTAGKDNMGGTAAGRLTIISGSTLGASGGLQTHTLTADQMPSHGHGVNDPGHVHNWGNTAQGAPVNAPGATGGFTQGALPPGALNTTSSTTGISIQASGNGQAHNNLQPTFVINKIIKV